MEMLARCVATLKPPPELTLSQWADRYRMLSAESSAEPGRWHTDKAPYQREIMDAIGDAHIRRVVIMCAAQLGKTELLLNILGYFMAYAPAPILVMQPTLDMGQTFSKDRLAPMIRDTPVLRGLVDVKSRYAGNTILKKNFPGGHITIVGANSATGLASRPIKIWPRLLFVLNGGRGLFCYAERLTKAPQTAIFEWYCVLKLHRTAEADTGSADIGEEETQCEPIST